MMPGDYHHHETRTDPSGEQLEPLPIASPDDVRPSRHDRATRRWATGLSIALTVLTVLVIVAAVLGVLMWLVA